MASFVAQNLVIRQRDFEWWFHWPSVDCCGRVSGTYIVVGKVDLYQDLGFVDVVWCGACPLD